MRDLISRQDVIDVLIKWYGCKPSDLNVFEDMLENLPSVQKRGEWKHYGDKEWLRDDGQPVYILCSECNNFVLNNASSNWNYCPNCGARMLRGDKDV